MDCYDQAISWDIFNIVILVHLVGSIPNTVSVRDWIGPDNHGTSSKRTYMETGTSSVSEN